MRIFIGRKVFHLPWGPRDFNLSLISWHGRTLKIFIWTRVNTLMKGLFAISFWKVPRGLLRDFEYDTIYYNRYTYRHMILFGRHYKWRCFIPKDNP